MVTMTNTATRDRQVVRTSERALIENFTANADFSKRRGLKGRQRDVEVRYDDDTDQYGQRTIDEVITTGMHLEMLALDHCWLEINGLHVSIRAERVPYQRQLRIVVTCVESECDRVETKGSRR